mmetsp:Transcript_22352/g.45048  ORF Transcript_22352/g.45048 Transcript_22352/m.45048 type:complete len:102 (+) Transcript_22352:2579-2884(+)
MEPKNEASKASKIMQNDRQQPDTMSTLLLCFRAQFKKIIQKNNGIYGGVRIVDDYYESEKEPLPITINNQNDRASSRDRNGRHGLGSQMSRRRHETTCPRK